MTELTAQFYQTEPFASAALDPTQRQILDVLKINQEMLGQKELMLLKQLEERLPSFCGNGNDLEASTSKNEIKLKVKQEQHSDFPVLSSVSYIFLKRFYSLR